MSDGSDYDLKEVLEIHELNGLNEAMDEEDTEEEIVTSEEECSLESDSDTEGRALVLRHSLHAQTMSNKEQRENIFYTRKIEKNKCNLIIDGGSCTNAIPEKLVNRLQLNTTRHPKPYKLKWLDDNNEVQVRRQALVRFSIRGYKDEVVPMDACEILLERLWQFDRKTIHDGEANVSKVRVDGKPKTLLPLPPSKVAEKMEKSKTHEVLFVSSIP